MKFSNSHTRCQVYNHGALTEKEAGKAEVRAGRESNGVDIQLLRVPFVRVSGRLVGMTPAAEGPSVTVWQGDGGTGIDLKPDGSFEVWRLDPGKYRLTGEWNLPNGQQVHTAGVDIEVAGSNIDNLELRGVPDSNIAGRLQFEDDAAKQSPQGKDSLPPMVMLMQVGALGDSSSVSVGADDTFRLEKIPAGKYRVSLSWNTAYVKSMFLGSTAIDGTVLDLSNGSGGADLSLLLSAATGSISGTVQDGSGTAAGAVVALVATDEQAGLVQRYTTVAPDGTYTIPNLAPENYKIVAIQEDELSFQGNTVPGYEDFMENVELAPGEKVTKDLKRRSIAEHP